MLTSLEKISRREISGPEICARTDVGIELSGTETPYLCSLPAVDARRFSSRLPWPPVTLVASGDYTSGFAPYPCCRLST